MGEEEREEEERGQWWKEWTINPLNRLNINTPNILTLKQ